MAGDNKLGHFLSEVSNWRWDDYVKAEKDNSYSSNESIIFALVRACAMQNLQAIKLSINRLDGKLKTPLKVEYPKIFYIYPFAEVPSGKPADQPVLEAPEVVEHSTELATTDDKSENDLPSLSIRQTLAKMSDYPRELPEQLVATALQTEQWLRNMAQQPDNIPMVKSVVAAHLLIMAQKRNIDAIGEVFDAIDGKLVETLQILGEDIYITSYSLTAPDGAYINRDGVLQLEAEKAQDLWAIKLGKDMTNA